MSINAGLFYCRFITRFSDTFSCGHLCSEHGTVEDTCHRKGGSCSSISSNDMPSLTTAQCGCVVSTMGMYSVHLFICCIIASCLSLRHSHMEMYYSNHCTTSPCVCQIGHPNSLNCPLILCLPVIQTTSNPTWCILVHYYSMYDVFVIVCCQLVHMLCVYSVCACFLLVHCSMCVCCHCVHQCHHHPLLSLYVCHE